MLKYDVYKWEEAGGKPEHYLAQAKRLLPPELEKQTMTFAEAFIAKGEAKALDQTRQAIELIEKGKTLDEINQLTGMSMNMLEFLSAHVTH